MAKYIGLILVLLLCLHASAQDAEPAPSVAEPSRWDEFKTKASEKTDEVKYSLTHIYEHRAEKKWNLIADYSVFETWVLNKYGFTIAHNATPGDTYEFEYAKGSLGWGYFGIDIGAINEQRFSLLWRSFNQRNTFSFVTGVYHSRFDVHLGSDLMSTVTGSQRTSVDILKLGTVGVTWGLGNRWQTKQGYVLGADWFVIHVPLIVTEQDIPFLEASSSEDKRGVVAGAVKVLKKWPAFAVVKVQLGFSF